MGDRTYTTITVRRLDFEQHKTFLADTDKTYADELDEEGDDVVTLVNHECNYAEWGAVEEYLQKNKIEYDKSWEDGGEYDAGELHARWVKGNYVSSETSRMMDSVLEELKMLQEAFKDPKKGMKILQQRILHFEPFEIRDIALPPSNALRFIEDDDVKKTTKKRGSK